MNSVLSKIILEWPSANDGAACIAYKNVELEQDIVSSPGFKVLDGVKFAAKVGHGYATACLGLDGFIPYLPAVIQNEQDDLAPWYVGITDDLADPVQGLHRIRLEARTQLSAQLPGLPKTTKKLAVVYLDLFLEYRLPTYEIVVGEISPGGTIMSSR